MYVCDSKDLTVIFYFIGQPDNSSEFFIGLMGRIYSACSKTYLFYSTMHDEQHMHAKVRHKSSDIIEMNK